MKRALAALLLAFGLRIGAGAQQPAAPRLSLREQSQRIALLPDEERRWFDLVEPILLPEERNFFLLLTQPHEREIFREEFWKRREREGLPPPLGPGYRRRYEELVRRADEVYDGRTQDAGRMVIAHGEPASIEVIECDIMFRHLEIWTYSDPLPGIHSARRYFFTGISPGLPRKLWRLGDSDGDILQPGSCRKNLEELHGDCVEQRGDPCLSDCRAQACHVYPVYQEIKTRQSSSLGGASENARVLALPPVPTEQLADLAARFPGIRDPRAGAIRVEGGSVSPTPTPEARLWMSADEMRDRILALEPRYRQWLDLAAPLLTISDLARFLQSTPSEKDRFIRDFFQRRS
jgi:GWxTD domain-containing protein